MSVKIIIRGNVLLLNTSRAITEHSYFHFLKVLFLHVLHLLTIKQHFVKNNDIFLRNNFLTSSILNYLKFVEFF